MRAEHIRNFSIIAHIDHGKSTLADRLMEITGTLTGREKMDQFLDKMDIERERGITIKGQTARGDIGDVIGLVSAGMIAVSAKKGTGVEEILEAVVRLVPPPSGDERAPAKGLVIDSWFDNYQGVVSLARMFDGRLSTGQKIALMSTGRTFDIQKVGVFSPHPKEVESLGPGEVGDTITDAKRPAAVPLPGLQVVRPMVFAGLYPVVSDHYGQLRIAIEKLRLNDSSFTAEPETSVALGFGC